MQMLTPVEPQPAYVALDRVDEFLLFLGRVGVVETKVAAAAEFLGHAEIQANRLGVTDVQIAVRLGWEAGDDGLHAPRIEVGLDDVANEIAAGLGRRGFGWRHRSGSGRVRESTLWARLG